MGFGVSQTDVTAIKAKTDLIPADIATQLDTNVPAVKAKTDKLPATPANETTSTTISSTATTIKERTDNLPDQPADNVQVISISRRLELWSTPTSVNLQTTPTTTALPSITIAGLPEGAVPTLAKAHLKVGYTEDDSGSTNYLDGDQIIQAQKAVGGSWIDAITAPDGGLRCAASSQGGGDVLGGDHDIKAQIPANGAAIDFQWVDALAVGDYLYLYAVQIILVIDYEVEAS